MEGETPWGKSCWPGLRRCFQPMAMVGRCNTYSWVDTPGRSRMEERGTAMDRPWVVGPLLCRGDLHLHWWLCVLQWVCSFSRLFHFDARPMVFRRISLPCLARRTLCTSSWTTRTYCRTTLAQRDTAAYQLLPAVNAQDHLCLWRYVRRIQGLWRMGWFSLPRNCGQH